MERNNCLVCFCCFLTFSGEGRQPYIDDQNSPMRASVMQGKLRTAPISVRCCLRIKGNLKMNRGCQWAPSAGLVIVNKTHIDQACIVHRGIASGTPLTTQRLVAWCEQVEAFEVFGVCGTLDVFILSSLVYPSSRFRQRRNRAGDARRIYYATSGKNSDLLGTHTLILHQGGWDKGSSLYTPSRRSTQNG